MKQYSIDKKYIKIYSDYDVGAIEYIKKVFKNASYNSENNVWNIPVNPFNTLRLKEFIRRFNAKEFSNKNEYGDLKKVGLPTKQEVDYIKHLVESELNLKMQPRDYQYVGITYMVKHKAVINADDMGLGKTGQTIVAVELCNLFPCLVVAPANVKFNWEKEWNKWVDGRTISVIDGKNKDLNTDVVIINYEQLNKYLEELKKIKFKVLVTDEAHYIKNGKSIRSKAVRKLSKGLEFIFELSGTFILNRPEEGVHPLQVLGRFEELFGNWKRFVYKFCDAKHNGFTLDTSGSSNELLLNKILRENCYIRREKRDVAKDLPEVNKQIIEIPSTNKREFDRAKNDIVKYLQEEVSFEAAFNAVNSQYLSQINTLRKLSIEGKLKGIMSWIDDFLESSDEKLVVFGNNVAPLEELSKKYKCPLINGSTSSKDKFKIVNDFKDSKDRILFGNTKSLGTGTDGLQDASSNMLVIQLPDTPGELEQAISRLHRPPQMEPVNCFFMFSNHGIDYPMWDILQDKYYVTDAVNKGEVNTGSDIKDMNTELVKWLKSNNNVKQ